jgi:APA family basic amino acid/polyamine antiporter
LYPESGGTYVYGRERLGPLWGHAAGWSFVVGKTASCAAMALTAGVYLWPNHAHAVAAAAVVALAAVNYRGIEKSARATRLIVAAVLAVLASVVVTVASSGRADPSMITFSGGDADGVLQAAGLLFFAFAGYARIATLGEEVCDPRRTIGRAIRISLAATLTLYAVLAVTLLSILGPGLASATAPLADAVRAAGASGLEPVVRGAAAAAALGALLSLLLGVSRTVLAMSRDGYLPGALAAVHPRFAVPHRAEITLAAVVAVLAAVTDLRAAIGFSSFAVLVYYAIANAAAATLGRRLVPAAGLLGCVLLAVFLPPGAALAGAAVVGAGALSYPLVRKR